MQEMKQVKNVFKDCEGINTILNANIETVNLYKKTNRLEMNLVTEEKIDIEQISIFEVYLKEKFQVNEIQFKIKNETHLDAALNNTVSLEWEKIIKYLGIKYPSIKAILSSSSFELKENQMNIILGMKGKDLLKAVKLDKILADLLENIYGIKYTIKYTEKEIEDSSYEEYQKEAEKEAIKKAKKEVLQQLQEKEQEIVSKNELEEESLNSPLIYGRTENIKQELTNITDISIDTDRVCIEGEVITTDSREIKNDKVIVMFNVFDGTSTITCKAFVENKKAGIVLDRIKTSKGIKVSGVAKYDQFAKEITIMANNIIEIAGKKKKERMDNAKEKRVELHMHTQMSQLDGITPVDKLLQKAVKWGMKAIAITDHGVVQAFPDAHKFIQKNKPDLKVIYGVEAYLVSDKISSVFHVKNQDINTTYCILDIETTGLYPKTDKITELGIIKMKNGEEIDRFECFVNPEVPIPIRISEITHITDAMVKDAETIDKVIPKMLAFIEDSVLVAHNASFDIGFITHNCEQLGYHLDNTYIDTLALAKDLFPSYSKYKLGIIADNLGIKVENAHRAMDDVVTLMKIFSIMLKNLEEKGVDKLAHIEKAFTSTNNIKNLETYHAIILAKNYEGLKNLYKLVSFSHLEYFNKKPKIPKSLYTKYASGLMIGTACEQGELYRALLNNKNDEEIEKIVKFYDYLEIQPLGNNEFMVREGIVPNKETLMELNRKIVKWGEHLNKLVVATCDVHFMDPADEIYRKILQAGQGYDDADNQAPLYFRTTEEMLEEFSYLGEEKAKEIVITNTNKVADMCEKISPISSEKCAPHIEGCEKEIEEITYKKAKELYGDPLPEIVKTRIDRELQSIIKNGFSVMYMIAQKLVAKSNEDGYLVGSRGSVGSSVAAYFSGITEVNALPPHYRCPNCKYSDFTDYRYKNGFDLPNKECPKCKHELLKDGVDIPFETFLGFDGDKEPDIDLNFSGEYQAKAHRYTEVIFGKGTTFKAGTIGTIADKTAFGFVKGYFEDKKIPISNAEIARLAEGFTGVKRTTGQHPGGIIVVPLGREIYEFCPVQHPADDPNSDIITTHFDYHSIDQNLLKLDILGHDDPTMIRMLQDLTGVNPIEIKLDDKKTMSIFSSTDAIGVSPEKINSTVGTFGVPEFGTKFVRGMLVDTKPTTFEELIRISGLSHGTDVWLNNAQELIKKNIATLNEAICTRDDIMTYLIKAGLPAGDSFKIMENVRKGKGLTEEQEKIMVKNDIPKWYIDSCKKIKYMFPKAHATAYVTMAFRIAWFKVHMPKAYYTAFFSIRASEFDSDVMIYGKEKVINKMKEIEMQGNAASTKDKNMYSVLELVLEMYERDIRFLPIDIYKSHSTKFIMEEDGIRPPLNSIPGLGTVAAEGIENAKKEGPFMSIEDLKIKSKIGKSVIEMLEKSGCLKGMSQSNQLSLF